MDKQNISRATLGRLPLYLKYLKSDEHKDEYISASVIANALELGEVLVRKDLASVCDDGRPKIGFRKSELINSIEITLGCGNKTSAIILGAGQLGSAILGYSGFSDYGIEIAAAFDDDTKKIGKSVGGKMIYATEELETFCRDNCVKIGIITVPAASAQAACDTIISAGITAIWNFAPVKLNVPVGVTVKNENLALSLAHLNAQANQ